MMPRQGFRFINTFFAAVLAVFALWILGAELTRPVLPYFPTKAAKIDLVALRAAAARAALIGVIRGDLWVVQAVTRATELFGDIEGATATATSETIEDVRRISLRAAKLAPHEARAWLLLSAVNARLNKPDTALLKMAYYTGLGQTALMPLRLVIATRSDAIIDDELQILIGGEIRTIVAHRPDLKPAILSAYRNATPNGKRLIEGIVRDLDADLSKAIHKLSEFPRRP